MEQRIYKIDTVETGKDYVVIIQSYTTIHTVESAISGKRYNVADYVLQETTKTKAEIQTK